MEFIIITGMSGAGKSRAVDALEDIGFYCVDNLPVSLIPIFYELFKQSKNYNSKVAVVTDIRSGDTLDSLPKILDEMKSKNQDYKVLFLDAKDYVLVRRYKETRRRHPLSNDYNSIRQSLSHERDMLRHIKQVSNYIIDTSLLSTAQLKNRISNLFLGDSSKSLLINCISFGFKYGLPPESDLVFDVRFLPNPFYIDELKVLTGLDKPVRNYVLQFQNTRDFMAKLLNLIDFLVPLYQNEGKSELVIAIGCTGGKHRSVALTQQLYNHLMQNNQSVRVMHRDILL